jgi:hypothetical protein
MQTEQGNWRIAIIVAAALVLITKLYLAIFTLGSNDVVTNQSFLSHIRQFGAIGTYQRPGVYGDPFNHPPFIIHFLRLLGFLGDVSPLPFSFWFRLPAIIADIGSLYLLSKLKIDRRLLLLFALCPPSILISGFHGNTDPVMIFFILLSLYIIESKGPSWLAGLAYGMSLNIKVVPLIFVPVFFFYFVDLRSIRRSMTASMVKFFTGTVVIVFLCSLPYVLMDPGLIAGKVLGYGSKYNRWGWPLLLHFLLPSGHTKLPLLDYDSAVLHQFLFTYFKYLLVLIVIVLSWRMNARNTEKPSLFIQCGAITALFLAITPGFGVQYLAWFIPFVVMLGLASTIFYYASSGAYLFAAYSLWSSGAWYYANSTLWPTPSLSMFLLSVLCWLVVVSIFVNYMRRLFTDRRGLSPDLGSKSA